MDFTIGGQKINFNIDLPRENCALIDFELCTQKYRGYLINAITEKLINAGIPRDDMHRALPNTYLLQIFEVNKKSSFTKIQNILKKLENEISSESDLEGLVKLKARQKALVGRQVSDQIEGKKDTALSEKLKPLLEKVEKFYLDTKKVSLTGEERDRLLEIIKASYKDVSGRAISE